MPTPIKQEVIEVLERSKIEGNVLFLPEQLDRPIYVATNKVLDSIGGKWSKKAKGHVFEDDIADKVDEILTTREMPEKNPLAFWYTPAATIELMIERAYIETGMNVLEPEAGEGAIADALRELGCFVTCVELDAARCSKLEAKGHTVIQADFLTLELTEKYDRVLMNPPFAVKGDGQAHIAHIRRAYQRLADNGYLIAVAPSSVTFRQDSKALDFRNWCNSRGHIEELPSESFKSSGTSVNTVLITLDKGNA